MDYRWYEDSTKEPTWTKGFPVVGQGTFFFNIIRGTSFSIIIKPAGLPEALAWQWLALEIYRNKAVFLLGKCKSKPEVLNETEQDGVGFDTDDEKTSYWLSFDRDRLVVKYGKGYCMEETTLLQHGFLTASETDNKNTRENLAYLFHPGIKKVIEFYDCKILEDLATRFYATNNLSPQCCSDHEEVKNYEPSKKKVKLSSRAPSSMISSEIDGIDFHVPKPLLLELEPTEGWQAHTRAKFLVDVESKVSFSRYPLVHNWPHLVLDSYKLSLFDLDKSDCIFSASLPPACQELYVNVAHGENIDLDWPPNSGEPKLSDAIRYSINTEGKTLHDKLKEKATEFGTKPNPNETYLRVTLGMCYGKSPGIPYVLEIWPYKHYSPIHSHGNSYAIIKVVHGSINVHVHNKKVKKHDQEPLKKIKISKGDVTWISPNWYQTHQLINDTSGDYCATLQCYQYGDEDQHHWPYFNYVSEQDQIEDFLPNSDFQFISLREKLLKEYQSYLDGQ